jgi:hypothetical protein
MKSIVKKNRSILSLIVSVAIDWNLSQCTTSDVEDLVSTIDPFISLREVDNITILINLFFFIYL